MLDVVRLNEHKIVLKGDNVVLRPMTEYDWDLIWKWNYNPNTLYFSEDRNFIKYSPRKIQQTYRDISKDALCFIIEVETKPVGDCWLQKMNIERILRAHPVTRCRRIDLIMGDIEFLNPLFSIDVVRTLTKFGFREEDANIIFGCEIPDYSRFSLKAFRDVGYQIYEKVKQSVGRKSQYVYDVILMREQYQPREYGRERRLKIDRRKFNSPEYKGPERRKGPDRRNEED
jgi:hypothetical protein